MNSSNNEDERSLSNPSANSHDSSGNNLNVNYITTTGSFIRQLSALTDLIAQRKEVGYLQLSSPNIGEPVILHQGTAHSGWLRFCEALQGYHHKLEDFEIREVELPKWALDILMPALEGKNIREFTFDCNTFGRDGILFLSHIVQRNPFLRTLRLRRNNIQDLEAMSCLSQAISNHPRLEKLFIDECGLGDDPIVLSSITRAVKDIRHVIIRYNHIGAEGAAIISGLLATNPRMESLNLSFNRLNDDSFLILAQALGKNTNLKFLGLTGSNMTELGKNALRKSIFDQSNLNSVATSNHSVHVKVSWGDDCILKMNKNCDAAKSRNKKIFLTLSNNNYEGGELELRSFNGVPAVLMPHTFGLLQQDPKVERHLSNIFEVLRWKLSLLFV